MVFIFEDKRCIHLKSVTIIRQTYNDTSALKSLYYMHPDAHGRKEQKKMSDKKNTTRTPKRKKDPKVQVKKKKAVVPESELKNLFDDAMRRVREISKKYEMNKNAK